MSKHGQLYNEWLTHNTMTDHKDRMEHSKVEETHNTREEIEEILYAPNLNITQGEYRTFIDEVVPKIVSTLHHQLQKATGKAYTKGRSDEAKTCTGCQGRCEEQLQKARHNWLREEIVRLEGMKEVFLPTTGEQRRNIKQGINEKLQTVIDRYQRELDQDK